MKITGGYLLIVTGSTIRRLRLEARLTQRKLAELAGLSQAHIAKIETGNVDPRLSTINRILKALNQGIEIKCRDVMSKRIISAKPKDSILEISETMIKQAISQIPIIVGKNIEGTITEKSIIENLGSNISGKKAEDIMEPPLPVVPEETPINSIRKILDRHQGLLVSKGDQVVGIITRSDLLKTIS